MTNEQILRDALEKIVRTHDNPHWPLDFKAVMREARAALAQTTPTAQEPVRHTIQELLDLYDAHDRDWRRIARAVEARYINLMPPQPAAQESALLEVIDQRDAAEDIADQLAAQIAAITDVDIGEHSSGNCPWKNAMLAADEFIATELRKSCNPAAQAPDDAKDDAPVGTLTIAKWRGLENTHFDYTGNLPDGDYHVHVTPIAAAPQEGT